MEIFKFDAISQVYAILKRDMWGIYLLSVTSSFHLYKKNWANYSFSWKKKKVFFSPKKSRLKKWPRKYRVTKMQWLPFCSLEPLLKHILSNFIAKKIWFLLVGEEY